ncbi:hypothetical protein KI387_013112, partial [Taxus chinensis]
VIELSFYVDVQSFKPSVGLLLDKMLQVHGSQKMRICTMSMTKYKELLVKTYTNNDVQ